MITNLLWADGRLTQHRTAGVSVTTGDSEVFRVYMQLEPGAPWLLVTRDMTEAEAKVTEWYRYRIAPPQPAEVEVRAWLDATVSELFAATG